MDRVRAAIYCRLSEEDRNKKNETDDSESIQNQKSMLVQYALEMGWEIYGIYSDDDYAGADRSRPQFLRLIDDAQNRRFDVVLCKTQSRFTRELELVEKYIHGLFPLWNIRFVGVVDRADTQEKGNKKARQLNGLINEWYLEDLSENVKSALTAKRKKGLHIGACALYGYQKDPQNRGRLLIDEPAARVVREVFGLFAAGYGKTAIARMLNDRGIPSPSEYKRQQGIKPEGSRYPSALWSYAAVSDMLANENYIGNMVQGRYESDSYKTKRNRPVPKERWIVVDGTHPPVVDGALFGRVQSLLLERSRPSPSGRVGLFANRARCALCGKRMRSCRSRGRSYLKCATRHAASRACPGTFIPVQALESAVRAELCALTERLLDKDALADRLGVRLKKEKAARGLKKELADCEKQREDFDRCIRALYLDRVRGAVREDDFLRLAGGFTAQENRLRLRADALRRQLNDIACREPTADVGALIERHIGFAQLDREAVLQMVDDIFIGQKNPLTGEIPVKIHWSF